MGKGLQQILHPLEHLSIPRSERLERLADLVLAGPDTSVVIEPADPTNKRMVGFEARAFAIAGSEKGRR